MLKKEKNLGKGPVMTVSDVTADAKGVYLRIDVPVSLDAFDRIETIMREKGLELHATSGSGSGKSCTLTLGPFTKVDYARTILEELRNLLQSVFDNEQKYVKELQSLEGIYPLDIPTD